jgi:general secretion pathway protein C
MRFAFPVQRSISAIELALIALAAYFQASGFSALVGHALAPPVEPDPPRAPRPPPASDHATVARAILERNPFDSVTPRPLGGAPLEQAGEATPPCEGLRALVVVAYLDPAWSMALISGPADPSAKLVRIGEEMAQKTVRVIEWNRVVLSAGPSLCEIAMFRRGKLAAPSAVAPPAVPAEIASKIERLGAGEFAIDRGVIAAVMENPTSLLRSIRLVPDQRGGRIAGIGVYGIEPHSLLASVGLENGDVLQSINGFELDGPEKAMEALARLRTADRLVVQVGRRGTTASIDLHVR